MPPIEVWFSHDERTGLEAVIARTGRSLDDLVGAAVDQVFGSPESWDAGGSPGGRDAAGEASA